MNSSRNLNEFKELRSLLSRADLDSKVKKQAIERLPKLIDEHEQKVENRNGRMVMRCVRKDSRRTLKHIITAVRNSGDQCLSRTESRELIRFIGCCRDFVELVDRAKKYRGRHNKISRNINETKARKQARSIELDETYNLIEINTAGRLRSTGKALQNCIGNGQGSFRLEELRDGETDFWAISENGKTIGLLAITTENQQISEAQGFRNSALNLSRELLLKILAILDVTADSEKEWIEHGAFSLFSREPDLQPKVVRAGSKTLEVWGLDGEVIIRDNGKRWSRFCRESDWSNDDCVLFQACNGDMSDVELLNLVINYPDLGEVLKEFQPSSLIGSSDSAEYVEAPRRRPRPQRRRRLRA